MTVPDRNMGICQEVFVEWTGPVAIRHPFVVTELPLPDTNRATLTVSAELVNATAAAVKGVLRGSVAGTDVQFRAGCGTRGRTKRRPSRIDPKPVMQQPAAVVAGELRRTVPVRSGRCDSRADGTVSDEQTVDLRRPPGHDRDAWTRRLARPASARQRPEDILPRRLHSAGVAARLGRARASRPRSLFRRREHELDLLRGHPQSARRVSRRLRPARRLVRQLFLRVH